MLSPLMSEVKLLRSDFLSMWMKKWASGCREAMSRESWAGSVWADMRYAKCVFIFGWELCFQAFEAGSGECCSEEAVMMGFCS